MDMEAQYAIYPSLRDRVVIVTGGASGIGEAIVEGFVNQRARVAFLDIQTETGHALVARLDPAGEHALTFYPCDLTNTPAMRQVVAKILAAFGTVDVLVNNAGDDTRHTIENVTPASWDQGLAVNLKHQFFMSQAVLPAMRAARRGSIINMSSIGWVIPSTNIPVYVTAKAAIVGMTRTMAHEVGGDNIRVNCVMPGAILTERQRRLWFTDEYRLEVLARQALKRMLKPDEVARVVQFLAADDSSAITNQSYIVDGGWV